MKIPVPPKHLPSFHCESCGQTFNRVEDHDFAACRDYHNYLAKLEAEDLPVSQL